MGHLEFLRDDLYLYLYLYLNRVDAHTELGTKSVKLNSILLWGMTSCCLVAVYKHLGEKDCPHLQGLYAVFLCLTVLHRNLRVTVGILVIFYQTTRCHIMEEGNLRSHSCQNLISHAVLNIDFEMRKQKENFNVFLYFNLLIGWQLSIWNCCKTFFSLP